MKDERKQPAKERDTINVVDHPRPNARPEPRQCIVFYSRPSPLPFLQRPDQTLPPRRTIPIASKDASGAIRVIANSRLTSNAWPLRPAPTPIAGSTLALLLRRRAEVIGGATEMTLATLSICLTGDQFRLSAESSRQAFSGKEP
jgi:hypothetical protein